MESRSQARYTPGTKASVSGIVVLILDSYLGVGFIFNFYLDPSARHNGCPRVVSFSIETTLSR